LVPSIALDAGEAVALQVGYDAYDIVASELPSASANSSRYRSLRLGK
jgi:hypothetical protein